MKGIRVITTYKCNLMCSSCKYRCSPSKKGVMNPLKFKDVVESAYNEGYKDYLIIDGGEPFLYASSIYKYLKKIKAFNIKKYIVTNGYWGQLDNFIDILSDLKSFGLNGVIIEYDYYHSIFLKEEIIKEAVAKCALSNLEVQIKSCFNTDGIKDEMDIETFEFVRRIKVEFNIAGFIFEKSKQNNLDTINMVDKVKNEKIICY